MDTMYIVGYVFIKSVSVLMIAMLPEPVSSETAHHSWNDVNTLWAYLLIQRGVMSAKHLMKFVVLPG